MSRAWVKVILLPPQLVSFVSGVRVPGRIQFSGESTMEFGWYPFWRAAAAVTSLNVEPGGYISRVARFDSGDDGSATRFFHARVVSLRWWEASSLG